MTYQHALTVEILETAVHEAFKLWHRSDAAGAPLSRLRLYQELQQTEQLNPRRATNQVLNAALETLRVHTPDAADILRLHFKDGLTGQTIAMRLNVAEGEVYRKQKIGIHHIAQALFDQERDLNSSRRAAMTARLASPTYLELFGVRRALEQLSTALCTQQPPWLLAIEGLGGSGKTALADAIARQMIDGDQWDDFAWVTVQQTIINAGQGLAETQPALAPEGLVDALLTQLLPPAVATSGLTPEARRTLLQDRLKRQPHLIVIDNLETQADLTGLLDLLRTLAGPSKFLLTTRQRALRVADLYHFPLPELTLSEALHCIRHEATIRNLPDLAAASDRELYPIYATVGGNPLALRLVVGQVHLHPLGRVLADLRTARGQSVEQLYTHIYRRAWDLLTEPTRRALLILPLMVEQGATFEELAAISQGQLGESELHDALETLLAFNLVDGRGGLHERRYTIHSLTRTFLHQQVLRWGEEL